MAVQLLQRLPFHLQLHLRVLLEHLGVPLPEQLGHPLVRHAAGAQTRRVRGTEVVNAEVRYLCSSQSSMPHRLQSLLMSAGVLITRKQPWTLSSESPLIPKRLDGDLGQRNLGDAVLRSAEAPQSIPWVRTSTDRTGDSAPRKTNGWNPRGTTWPACGLRTPFAAFYPDSILEPPEQIQLDVVR